MSLKPKWEVTTNSVQNLKRHGKSPLLYQAAKGFINSFENNNIVIKNVIEVLWILYCKHVSKQQTTKDAQNS